MHNTPALLIATLGTEAQVVTAALDLLLHSGEAVVELVVLHTHAPGTLIEQSLQRLEQDFNLQTPDKPHIPLRLVLLRASDGAPLPDVATPQAAQAAFSALYQQVLAAKKSGFRVHLSIAGGRKTLAVYGMAAAQMLFDEDDRLWHLFSSGDFLLSKRLHPLPQDDVHLVSIPVILWSQVSPLWRGFEELQDPFLAVQRIQQLRIDDRLDQARTFVLGSLTPAERRVVELLVQKGLGDEEIASRLFLSPRTVEQHLRSAYLKAQAHWQIADISRTQLVTLLNLFYSFNAGFTQSS